MESGAAYYELKLYLQLLQESNQYILWKVQKESRIIYNHRQKKIHWCIVEGNITYNYLQKRWEVCVAIIATSDISDGRQDGALNIFITSMVLQISNPPK